MAFVDMVCGLSFPLRLKESDLRTVDLIWLRSGKEGVVKVAGVNQDVLVGQKSLQRRIQDKSSGKTVVRSLLLQIARPFDCSLGHTITGHVFVEDSSNYSLLFRRFAISRWLSQRMAPFIRLRSMPAWLSGRCHSSHAAKRGECFCLRLCGALALAVVVCVSKKRSLIRLIKHYVCTVLPYTRYRFSC